MFKLPFSDPKALLTQTTFCTPDLTTFCLLDQLGLQVSGQHLQPDLHAVVTVGQLHCAQLRGRFARTG